ncbi:hypothetical protein [Klebsiella phage BUCT_49532]|uniref:hypothetical protein n=1 Tax=Klebsiella phage BUCT_49532 TaxID=2849971 RepID=UPI001C75361C|nr:hypothetical protein PQZ56_gp42 [Klebsiella phage BUCT_49532]WCI99740.1 hypothetical protein [Klebsiella phage BUCT_49532]
MTNIDFIIPISAYSGFSISAITEVMLNGESVRDICLNFQSLSVGNATDGEFGFFYDYLCGLIDRYPDLLESINQLRADNDKSSV